MPAAFWYGLLSTNLYAFGLFAWDKRAARLQRRRVPENWLLLASFLAGGLPAWGYMSLLRHKTRKRSFQFKLVLVCLVVAACVWAYAEF